MKYICQLCGYVYDDEKEAVPFAELPDDWTCPLCGAPKSLFKAQEESTSAVSQNEKPNTSDAESPVKAVLDEDGDVLVGLNAGQLAALCGNLSRGCEKQARQKESELFAKLATYFDAHVAPVEDAGIDALAEMLLEDGNARYKDARTVATSKGDRGTLRVITWGERITNMCSYLVDRYLKEGVSFLEDTEVWVCTVCGFIYVGDNPPELCPVCKVPAWKFEHIERRAS